jgi:phosphatidylserine/phosphatidylglycerophosphate/cardiolipin synthase-like enzyme
MTPGAQHIPAVSSGAYPVRTGNFVRPLVDGEAAFRRICEAVESAQHSAWVTVAFIDRDVQMPDGRGGFFDVLTAQRVALDVRALFWRFEPHGSPRIVESAFRGDEEERAWLAQRGSRFFARWDHNPGYCHHQKSWAIDAGQPGETAFVGGINLHNNSVVPSGHPYMEHKWGSTHDVYVELRGPAATDVHHNFVQRWNEASERGHEHGAWQEPLTCRPTEPRMRPGTRRCKSPRTVRAGAYSNASHPGRRAARNCGRRRQHSRPVRRAIDAAREYVYFGNQAIGCRSSWQDRGGAQTGRRRHLSCPAGPAEMTTARKHPSSAPFFEQSRGWEHVTLPVGRNRSNVRLLSTRYIYVHAKTALDDAWRR